jgi:CBS domain-containing protein
MRTIEAQRRSGVGVGPATPLQQVAALMDQANVGSVAVIDDGRLVGIVTDRDLVRRALARGLSPQARVDGVMSAPVHTIGADADVHAAFGRFRSHGVRRLAVTKDGAFVGMITVDDLLIDLAADLSDLARPITAELIFGHHDAGLPVRADPAPA